MKNRISVARKRIMIVSILLIIVCVVVMLIPKESTHDTEIVNEDVEISEPIVPEQDPIIKEDGAITIVLKRLPGAKASDIQSFAQEYIDGGWVYEGSIKVPKKKIAYEFQIDADVGTILQWEAVKIGEKRE